MKTTIPSRRPTAVFSKLRHLRTVQVAGRNKAAKYHVMGGGERTEKFIADNFSENVSFLKNALYSCREGGHLGAVRIQLSHPPPVPTRR